MYKGGDILDDTLTSFLAWQVYVIKYFATCIIISILYTQTWDLLRMTVAGFKGLCSDFFVRNPGYFMKPVRVNGSVVESLFGRFKYNADGHLSAMNYRGCMARLIIVSDAREDYRTSSIDRQDVLTRKKAKRSN